MKFLGVRVPFTSGMQEKGNSTVSNWGSNPVGHHANFQNGGWQGDEDSQDITRFSALTSCVNIISSDLAKLPVKVYRDLDNGGHEHVPTSPLSRVLIKPNRYQSRMDFMTQIMMSTLMRGNAYIYKEFDSRGQIAAMYVLNPDNTKPLVDHATGDVYYSVGVDPLVPGLPSAQNEAALGQRWNIPQRFIMHHRLMTFKHPLEGISPLHYAATSAATGRRIQTQQKDFFDYNAHPRGI